ncbi:MAG: type III-B CRISPR module RAMP protein Cmr1 [Firmicutes bacterium]|nr:type III-B CRISPR module RAMP protein Cmr1 [Bacillota bacterium]
MRHETKYKCAIITPLFMGGANPQQVELRVPSLKGVIRFWWRALYGNLDIRRLKEEEAKLFGSSHEKIGRSKLSLRIPAKQIRTFRYSPVPHWEGNPSKRFFKLPAAEHGQSFQVLLTSRGDKATHEKYQAIFEAALLLGGFGKRSRRGFGSIQITKRNEDKYQIPQNINDLKKLLEKINPGYFAISDDGRKIVSKSFSGHYPYIKEIEIGKDYSNVDKLLRSIGQASSDYACDYLGFTRRKNRFASPIYVSVIKHNKAYKPIITTLHTSFKPEYRSSDDNKQERFKGAIL